MAEVDAGLATSSPGWSVECHLPRLGVNGSQADLPTESRDAMSSPPPFCSPENCLPQASRRLPTPVWYSRLRGTVCDEALSIHPSHSLDRQGLCSDGVSGIVLALGSQGKRPHPFPQLLSGELLGRHPDEDTEASGHQIPSWSLRQGTTDFSYALHIFSDGEPLNV